MHLRHSFACLGPFQWRWQKKCCLAFSKLVAYELELLEYFQPVWLL